MSASRDAGAGPILGACHFAAVLKHPASRRSGLTIWKAGQQFEGGALGAGALLGQLGKPLLPSHRRLHPPQARAGPLHQRVQAWEPTEGPVREAGAPDAGLWGRGAIPGNYLLHVQGLEPSLRGPPCNNFIMKAMGAGGRPGAAAGDLALPQQSQHVDSPMAALLHCAGAEDAG